jgi:hypothetical protein
VPERLFLFLQLELPWELGPPDGRYLLRARAGGEPERVVVLSTLGATRRRPSRRAGGGRRWSRRSLPETTSEPVPVATARATIVDPIPLLAERQAHAWLAELDPEREARAATAMLGRVLHAHRIAAADPYLHEVSPAQALVIRAGWGKGEQVADGLWLHARELPWAQPRARRAAALRPQERLARLLGARGKALLCEELALRARLDLDHRRLAHAALELDGAYATALAELSADHRPDFALRLAELEQLRSGVTQAARAALPGREATAGTTGPAGAATAGGTEAIGGADEELNKEIDVEPDEEIVRHALERLEAALRAHTAAGFTLT